MRLSCEAMPVSMPRVSSMIDSLPFSIAAISWSIPATSDLYILFAHGTMGIDTIAISENCVGISPRGCMCS